MGALVCLQCHRALKASLRRGGGSKPMIKSRPLRMARMDGTTGPISAKLAGLIITHPTDGRWRFRMQTGKFEYFPVNLEHFIFCCGSFIRRQGWTLLYVPPSHYYRDFSYPFTNSSTFVDFVNQSCPSIIGLLFVCSRAPSSVGMETSHGQGPID
jgi:hypothetical protein